MSIFQKNGFVSAGVRAMFLSTFAFSMANVFVKQVSHLPAMEIVFFRCFAGCVFCYFGLKRAKASFVGTNNTLLLLRGLFGTAALYFFFVTVQNIPLATAMTVQYLSPIFTTIIAIFLLNEKVMARQWIFYAIAFSGVVLIEQVDARVSPMYLAMGIASAFGSGMAYNLVRSLKGREHPLTVVFQFQFVGMAAGLVFTLFNWKSPAGWDWFYLLLIGIFSQLGQVFLTDALQKERAASVAIIIYTGLIYGISIGWLAFGETHGAGTIGGMLLVVVGIVLSVLYGRRKIEVDELDVTNA
ncbi:MAG: DMT family transporter [Acidobacteria bacterium]|nr:DMT family transporter [Acidobacteriota bacterium]MBK8150383.1 DMT family transporter [Acidobacteriota bacterium]